MEIFEPMITEENFLDFTCPYCGEPVSFPADHAGTAQACPTCNESVIVPGASGEPGAKIPLPAQTPRLILRRFAPGDWKDLLELMGQEELFQYTDGGAMDEDAVLAWLDRDRHVRFTTPGQPVHLAIEARDGNRVIGFVALHFHDAERRQVQPEMYILPDWQKKGIGLEVGEALLGFCFEGLKLHRLSVSCDSRNVAARRLCEHLGLRREGEFLKNRYLRGEWVDTVFYAALLDEWLKADA
jgi:[ribosomal protein S5]-alanine N-acetyltransferase